MEKLEKLVGLLSDGRFHSGEKLGEHLDVSRAAVWKNIKQLERFGLAVDSVRGKGYRINGGIDLLDAKRLNSYMSSEVAHHIKDLSVLISTNSTNENLLKHAENNPNDTGYVLISEQQKAGRGRRGKEWVSPFAANLYCSVLWRFNQGMSALDGLSLAIALGLVSALEDYGVEGLGLKWPNDVLHDGKKLAGILIEITGDVNESCQVVVGFGVNYSMPLTESQKIDQPWVDIETLMGEKVDRNRLTALIIEKIVSTLVLFERDGFAGFSGDWEKWDLFRGQMVQLLIGEQKVLGTYLGVNSQGALLLETANGREVFHGGEVSLRRVS